MTSSAQHSNDPLLVVTDASDAICPSLKVVLETLNYPTEFRPSGQISDLTAASAVEGYAGVIVALDTIESQLEHIDAFLEQLSALDIATLVLDTAESQRSSAGDPSSLAGIVRIAADTDPAILQARLETLLAVMPRIRRLSEQLADERRRNAPLNDHFHQVDQEMRLAGRLQRDFLPSSLPSLDGLHFSTVFRPATWVSGDIYDVLRLDEDHVGFYLADAMGHGMPAALMTMFIKRAMVTKEIAGNSYRLIDPGQVLARLNHDMADQQLSNFQFATCCYGILNHRTHELRVASGGHPAPIHITGNGTIRQLPVKGTLLGVFDDQDYQTLSVTLTPGDKLLLYSDGLEDAFELRPEVPLYAQDGLKALAGGTIDALCAGLVGRLDALPGSLNPNDDVTLVGLEITQ